jgi:hypothetical protein
MSDTYSLLAGGYRDSLVLFTFEPSTSKIHVSSENPAPPNASWVEKSHKDPSIFYSLSEDEKAGKAVSLRVKDGKVDVTSERYTNGGAAHGRSQPASFVRC